MDKSISLIESEWAVITSAPFTIIAVAALIFGVVHWIYRERMKSLKDLVAFRDARIRDFQEKTKAETPDEAKMRLEALERAVEDVAYSAAVIRPPL